MFESRRSHGLGRECGNSEAGDSSAAAAGVEEFRRKTTEKACCSNASFGM